MPVKPSVSIIGVGRIGGALALALSRKGYRIADLVYRGGGIAESIAAQITPALRLRASTDLAGIESDVILITTGDPDIETVASALAGVVSGTPTVFHTSGLLSSKALESLKDVGCKVGSMHPLVSVSDAFRGADSFDSAYFCLEGDSEALTIAEAIVNGLKGLTFAIPTEFKSLYHASAVTASGHLVALIDVAVSMLSKCGLENDEAKTILMPLIRSTIDNLATQSTADALTGSFARGDSAAVDAHLAALQRYGDDDERDVYSLLGERSLLLAGERGVARERVEAIRNAISIAKRNTE